MKDLTIQDIYIKPQYETTQISIYARGRWLFGALTDPVKSVGDSGIYRINLPFKLLKENDNNPASKGFTAPPGDYVSRDAQGVLTHIPEAVYKIYYPPINSNPPYIPPTSSNLKDPNYLTNIVEESKNQDSNGIVVGNTTFKSNGSRTTTTAPSSPSYSSPTSPTTSTTRPSGY
jgi:hypothetical protein|tara:strand:+ start:33 stop:554 length:522 start_codon:yes stop_codon:yes gene_type:complete